MNYKHLLWKFINSERYEIPQEFTAQEREALWELDAMREWPIEVIPEAKEKDVFILEDINQHVYLPKERIHEFVAWLDKRGISHREGRGDYQVIQVIYDGKPQPLYRSYKYPHDYKAIKPLNYLVMKFLKESHG